MQVHDRGHRIHGRRQRNVEDCCYGLHHFSCLDIIFAFNNFIRATLLLVMKLILILITEHFMGRRAVR